MSDTMEYKGYTGSVEYSAEDNLLFGRLIGIRDRILFDGADVKTLQKHFHEAVDEYLAFCKAEGKTPDRPFKGSLNIRIPAELHRTLALTAEQEHKSLNSVIADRLGESFRSTAASAAQATVAYVKQSETGKAGRRREPAASYRTSGKAPAVKRKG